MINFVQSHEVAEHLSQAYLCVCVCDVVINDT